MKTVAIVNPVAGFRRAPHAWPVLLNRLGARAAQVVTWWTKGPGHAEFLAALAKRSGFDRVHAVGGDGTIFEVANGLWWESEGRLGPAVEKWFWEPLNFGENLPKVTFLKPTHLIKGLVPYVSSSGEARGKVEPTGKHHLRV